MNRHTNRIELNLNNLTDRLNYDPIHRRLIIDDEEENRTWCVVQYSFILQIFDSILHILHFIIPFSINCYTIINVTRTHSNARKQQSYRQHLILIVQSFSFDYSISLSGCMESVRDP